MHLHIFRFEFSNTKYFIDYQECSVFEEIYHSYFSFSFTSHAKLHMP